jgi:hypothetical protein
MADYNPLGYTRHERNQLPSHRKPLKSTSPEGHAPRPPLDFSDEVRIVYDELMSLLLSKHKDYGAKNIADAPGGALNGLRVRMHDKLARINNLVDRDINPEHESLEDSFKDMANYAIIGLLVLRGKWGK